MSDRSQPSVTSTLSPSPPPPKSSGRLQTPAPISSHTLRTRPWRRYVTPFDRILEHRYPGQGTPEDPYIVDWLPDDPEDPQRWSTVYKWSQIMLTAVSTLAVALSSSAYSGGIESLIADFGIGTELLTAGISLFVVGFAFGPLMWAPASEVWGRRPIYILSYILLTLWQGVTCAAQTIAQILVFRFFAGLFGSSPLANAGGTISDVLDANQRGLGMAFFAAAPFLGPALGPITGGFLGLKAGWRWVEGFLAIFCGVIAILLTFFSAETYAPSLLRKRANLLAKVTGKEYRFRADAKQKLQIGKLFKTSLIRPWKFLIYEPIVIILTIYTAVIYGVLYLNFSAYPIVFEELRGWNTGEGGLAFLGILIGVVASVPVSAFYINPRYIKIANKRGGRATPEDRLPPAIWAGFLIVIGLAGFAATDSPSIHWIAPIIFGIPFGFGVIIVFLSVLGYLIDSYTIYAASVLAANSVLRSLFGAAFPLFTDQMYEKLGIHWAAALPAFIAAACIPFTLMFYKFGATIRAKCRYASDAERQMEVIMAARKAASKQDVEAKDSSNGTAGAISEKPVGGASAPAPGGDVANDKLPQTFPAEQAGGEGVTAVEAEREKLSVPDDPNADQSHLQPSHPSHPAYHQWTMYEALADRDETDLNDDERVRLEVLHRQFGLTKASPSSRNLQQDPPSHVTPAHQAPQAPQHPRPQENQATEPPQQNQSLYQPQSQELHQTLPAPQRLQNQPGTGADLNFLLGKPLA